MREPLGPWNRLTSRLCRWRVDMGLGGMKDRKVHAAESQSAASRPVTFRIETTYWGPETRRRLVHWREQRERLGVRWTSRKRSGSIGDLATHRSAGGIYLNWGGYNMSTRYHDPGQETWNLPPIRPQGQGRGSRPELFCKVWSSHRLPKE